MPPYMSISVLVTDGLTPEQYKMQTLAKCGKASSLKLSAESEGNPVMWWAAAEVQVGEGVACHTSYFGQQTVLNFPTLW